MVTPSDIDSVRAETRNEIIDACQADYPVLVEAPPSSGKTSTVTELPEHVDTPITYVAGRIDLYRELADTLANRDGITAEIIPSPHRDCPTFAGEHGAGPARQARRLYRKGVSGYKIHYSERDGSYTPCMDDDSECEYIQRLIAVREGLETNSIDLLIGHHSHLDLEKYVEDRLVIVDEFNYDSFVNHFPSDESNAIDTPGKIISNFLSTLRQSEDSESVDPFPVESCEDVTDILELRADQSVRQAAFDWFAEHGVTRRAAEESEFIDISSYRYNKDHMDAPLLTFSLFCMESVGPGVEVAPAHTESVRQAWEDAGLPSAQRVLRNRNTGEMHVLRPPLGLGAADQIVGLDGTPTHELWKIVYAPDDRLEHQQVLSNEQMGTYLTDALGMTVFQVGNAMHHYAGGRTSDKDADRFERIHSIEGNRFPLISTKKALETYRAADLLTKHVARCSNSNVPPRKDGFGETYAVRNYARVRSSNAFKNEPVGAVFGSPFPGDDLVKRWAGFTFEAVDPSGEGEQKEFDTDFGDAVFQHFSGMQVLQAMLRFGRSNSIIDGDGSRVYVSTHALPDWVPTINIRDNEKENAVFHALQQSAELATREVEQYHTARTLAESITNSSSSNYPESVEAEYVGDILTRFAEEGFVECREGYAKHGADQYRWTGNEAVDHLENGSVLVRGNHNAYYLG